MKIIKKILFIILLFLVSFCIYFTVSGYKMYKDAIDKTPLSEKVEEIQNKENYTKITDMPKIYLDAVISIEDHKFYKHHGVSVSAFLHDIEAKEFLEGGSTITEQLSKNMYFTQEKDLKRKVAEVFVTLDLEKNYTKSEILELYLNTSYFGNGYYTVSEASKGYFNKDAKDITDSEATLLAGIPNAPSVYNPKENLKLAKERQKQVLDKMVQYKKITKEKEDEILSKE
jgi:monofunctional glycosyltransferase